MLRALLLLMLPGCLYVGDVNRAPTASLKLDTSRSLIKGATLQLTATMQDPEDGANLPPVWAVESSDGTPLDGHCDYRLNAFEGDVPGQPRAEVTFYRTGSFVISFQTFDRFRAPSNASTVMVDVVDAPPVFSGSDLQAKEAKDLQCNTYTAGQPLTLFFNGQIDDADAMLPSLPAGCPATYQET